MHVGAYRPLLHSGKVDPNCKSARHHGWTPLCCTDMTGHLRVVSALLHLSGIETNELDSHGRNPLSWACGKGFVEEVKLLLVTKAVSTTIEDVYGNTTRTCAASNGHDGVVMLFDSYEKSRRNLLLRFRAKIQTALRDRLQY